MLHQAKELAVKEKFKSSGAIVDELLLQHDDETPGENLQSRSSLRRATNLVCQKVRPNHPINLDFELNIDHVPSEFIRGYILVGDRRHLVFATEAQIHLLQSAKFVRHSNNYSLFMLLLKVRRANVNRPLCCMR